MPFEAEESKRQLTINPMPSMKSKMTANASPTFPVPLSSTQPSANTEQGRITPPPINAAYNLSSGTYTPPRRFNQRLSVQSA